MDKYDLKAEIRRLLNERGAVVVAIDGNSASGKTTLAEELREEVSASYLKRLFAEHGVSRLVFSREPLRQGLFTASEKKGKEEQNI